MQDFFQGEGGLTMHACHYWCRTRGAFHQAFCQWFSLTKKRKGGGVALSQSDARISVAYKICQWKSLTKRLMKCPGLKKLMGGTPSLFLSFLKIFGSIFPTRSRGTHRTSSTSLTSKKKRGAPPGGGARSPRQKNLVSTPPIFFLSKGGGGDIRPRSGKFLYFIDTLIPVGCRRQHVFGLSGRPAVRESR